MLWDTLKLKEYGPPISMLYFQISNGNRRFGRFCGVTQIIFRPEGNMNGMHSGGTFVR